MFKLKSLTDLTGNILMFKSEAGETFIYFIYMCQLFISEGESDDPNRLRITTELEPG